MGILRHSPNGLRIRWIVIGFTALLALFWSAALANHANASSGKPALTVGVLPGDVGNLNPALNNAQMMDTVAYQSLTHITPGGAIEPGLATAWHYVGRGNKIFELTLRHGVRFSNGTPLTATAVTQWLTYFNSAPGNPHGTLIPGAKFTAIGKWTVKITLATPDPNVPWSLGESGNLGFVAAPQAVSSPSDLSATTYGAGPYMLDASQTVANSTYTYVPNPHYYNKSAIHFSKVVLKVIPTPTAMLQALQAGQIDVGHGDFTTAAAAQAAGFQVSASPAQTDEIVLLDLTGATSKALGNAKVREALNYAINRKAITKALFGKYGTPSSEIGSSDGDTTRYVDYYSYDPAKAKALLQAAGYSSGLTFSVMTYGSSSGNGYLPMVEAVANDLQAVGVKLNITTEATGAAWSSALASHTFSGTGVQGGFAPTWYLATAIFTNPSVYNQHGWVDPGMTALEKKAATAKSPLPFYQKILGRATTDAALIPVAFVDTLWYAKKGIHGVAATGHAQGVANTQEWYTG